MGKIDETNLDEQQEQDRMQKMIDCITNLTKTGNVLLQRIVALENKMRALELHAEHQDEARRK